MAKSDALIDNSSIIGRGAGILSVPHSVGAPQRYHHHLVRMLAIRNAIAITSAHIKDEAFLKPHTFVGNGNIRETREGWPLLTVETEVNGDSKSTNERGLPWLVCCGLVVPVKEIFVLPWLL